MDAVPLWDAQDGYGTEMDSVTDSFDTDIEDTGDLNADVADTIAAPVAFPVVPRGPTEHEGRAGRKLSSHVCDILRC